MDGIGVKQFAHVSLDVADMAKSIDFYTRHFGFRVGPQLRDDTGHTSHTYLHTGAGMFIELIHREPAGSFNGHLSFEVESMDEAHAYCRTHGMAIIDPPRTGKVGSLMMFIRDPDGYRIELNDHTPPESQIRAYLNRMGED